VGSGSPLSSMPLTMTRPLNAEWSTPVPQPRSDSTSQPSRAGRRRTSGRPTSVGGSSRRSGSRPSAYPNQSQQSQQSPPRPRRRDEASDLDRALTAALDAPAPVDATFLELGVPESLARALAARGVHAPFAIQTRTLPDALAGRDVLGRAQTGSGKTLAFGLPMLARLAVGGTGVTTIADGGTGSAGRNRLAPGRAPRGLVLVPTRELASQVADVISPLGDALGLRTAAIYGGAPIGRQIDRMRRGVDIVVATPGRLLDLMERRSASLDAIEIAVLDEADHMADLGFLPDVSRILDATPAGGQRMLFSATLDRGVDRVVRRYLNDPAMHAAAPAAAPVEAMDHRVFVMPASDKVAIAAEIASRPARTLFFVRTKHGADRLAMQLGRAGVEAAAIHGNLNQNQRQRALRGFSAGHPRVLVATDVAARGIHVDDVDLVVHYDPPNDHKDYLHRSGRTARAGAAGTVVALVEPAQVRALERLHEAAGVSPRSNRVRPGDEAVRAISTSGEPVPPPPPAQPSGPDRDAKRPGRGGRSGGGPRGPRGSTHSRPGDRRRGLPSATAS
jgi:superfamily II DNA/RNA helicase